MSQRLFIRNIRALDQLELFIVSAVSSLLLLRFYLYLTGYPQVGGGNLHIAHMLWGGALMLISMILSMSFLGQRILRLNAFIGGIGFGIFIDEIGKFLTKDNNYFFRPAIGIIYAIFVILYLVADFLGRRTRYTSREYQLNAVAQLEEAVLLNLDASEKARTAELLKKADPDSPITKHLTTLLHSVDTVAAEKPNRLERLLAFVDKKYQHLWKYRESNWLVQGFFIIEVGLFTLAVLLTLASNFDSVRDFFEGTADYGHSLVIGQLASTIVAAVFAGIGIVKLASDRSRAFEYFRRATITNLLLTEFFMFSRLQFGAMPSFIFNLVLLGLINLVIAQENRQTAHKVLAS